MGRRFRPDQDGVGPRARKVAGVEARDSGVRMRKKSSENGLKTAGDGLEWSLVIEVGPGLTVETMLCASWA